MGRESPSDSCRAPLHSAVTQRVATKYGGVVDEEEKEESFCFSTDYCRVEGRIMFAIRHNFHVAGVTNSRARAMDDI